MANDEIYLIKWLAEYTDSRHFYMYKGKVYSDYLLCFTIDLENSWDGMDDDSIQWYTPEEMFENYKNNKFSNTGSRREID